MLTKLVAVLFLIAGICGASALDVAVGAGGTVALLGGFLAGSGAANIWLSA